MTKRFLNTVPFIFKVEGTQFENDPADPGGATRFGIDSRSHPDVDIRNLTADQARAIYWSDYWQKNNCESLSYPLGECFFDICVNNGRARADKLMRISGNASALLRNRDDFYRRLAAANPAMNRFLKGWLNRDNELRKRLGIGL